MKLILILGYQGITCPIHCNFNSHQSQKPNAMRWESDLSTTGNEVYHLYKGDKHLLTLTLNSFSNAARVECNKQKRIFFIRKEGFLRNKTVLLNEYGIRIGELGHENNETFIAINDEKFFYTTNDNPKEELIFYTESKEKPIVTCNLTVKNGNSNVSFEKNKKLSETSHPGLLMALCWYMFLPATKEKNQAVEAV